MPKKPVLEAPKATFSTPKGTLPRIGFIGIGIMGTPMSAHLHKAGYSLILFDVNAKATRQHAKALGAASNVAVKAVATPAQVASQSDIIITMLPNGQVVQDVVFGKNGLSDGLKPGCILLDTSSAEPWLTQDTAVRLARQGVSMVDAPVSGAQWGAQEANLVFMAGGTKADLARVKPLLDVMGRAVFHVGPLGSGHAMKCINNLITAVTFSATVEGLAIGKAYGLDPAAMVQVLNQSTGQSWISQNHIEQRVISRSFDDPFKLALMLKDMGIANALARQTATGVPLSGLAHQLWQSASRAAGEGASVSELARWVEGQAGVQITPGAGKKPAKSAKPPKSKS